MEKTFVYSNFAITFDDPKEAHEFINKFYSFLQNYNLYDRVSIYNLKIGNYPDDNERIWKR